MRLRNWLLTGTSITMLALAPTMAARAQDATNPDLVAAYQAYTADQSDANKQKLTEACIAAGFQSMDDCIAALGQPQAAPSEKAAPPAEPAPSSEEAAPAPSSEEAAPAPSSKEAAPAPSSEVAAPAPSSQEPAPAPVSEQAAPSSEAPAPAPSSEAAPAPSSEAAPAPSSEEAAPAPSSEQAAPVASSQEAAPAPSSEQVAPVASSQEAAPAPSSEQAAPAPSSSVEAAPATSSEHAAPAPSSQAPADNGALQQLTDAVDLYNQGVADLTAGDQGGQAKIDKAKATIDKICGDAGFDDTSACLAQFGLTLAPLPAAPGEPAASSEQQQAASSVEPSASSSEMPVSEMPKASEAVTPSAVEVLPPDASSQEAAPILDSVKDQQTSSSAPQDQASQDQASQASSSEPQQQAEPAAPPPTDDSQAQADLPKPTPEQKSSLKDKGEKAKVQDIQVAPPQNADQPIKVIQAPAPRHGGPDNGPANNGNNNGPGNNTPPPQNNGIIIQIGVNLVINNPDQERSRYYDPQQDEIYYEDLSRGRTRETVTRPNGVKIVTIRNRHGDILQRSKILPNGKEIVLATYDPKDQDLENWRDPGADLPPLHLTIPASQYILDANTADESDVYQFLDKPPVEKVRRIYTIDEVKRSARLRDSVRRLEVGGLTFDTGKATISRSQVGSLSKIADAMQKMLDQNPGEVFLIEGHTDAVGSDVSNLVLSDQRAATVARILTDFYEIPPENLVTQGYGERYLRVKTDGPEPLNRRVTIKRITPLVSYSASK